MTSFLYFLLSTVSVILLFAPISSYSQIQDNLPFGFLPNIIIFYADDLGWGDLQTYGHPHSVTPHLDEIARTGIKFLSFYSSSPVCSPSRAALLTGRFQTRNGVWGNANSGLVFYQPSIGGLPLSEITIAEFLKSDYLNYITAIIGKWHLGIGENNTYLPTRQGFDFWTGLPTVNDDPNPPFCWPENRGCWPETAIDPWNDTCPDSYTNEISMSLKNMIKDFNSKHSVLSEFDSVLDDKKHRMGKQKSRLLLTLDYELAKRESSKYMYIPPELRMNDDRLPMDNDETAGPANPLFWNEDIIQQPVNITMLPDFYSNAAKQFMSKAVENEQPFFLYMAYHETHHPQFASSRWFNQTQRGMFGDALAEMDYNIGILMDYLTNLNISSQTLVFFSADNGPSLMRQSRGGSAGTLKCGKGTTYEGGVREPALMWMNNGEYIDEEKKYRIKAGRVTRGMGSTLDIFPTIAEIVGKSLPTDRYYDGISMFDWIFTDNGQSMRDTLYYWPKDPDPTFGWQKSLHAVRKNEWKLHWITGGSHCGNSYADSDCRDNATEKILEQPLLYNLYHDVGERYPLDISQQFYSNIVQELNDSWHSIFNTLDLFAVSEIGKGQNSSLSPCCACQYGNPLWPSCCDCDRINQSFPMFI